MKHPPHAGSISRRAVVAGALASAVGDRLGAQQSDPKPANPKLGLIGLGNRAQRHLATYRELADVEIVALSDIQADRMRAARTGPAADAEMYVDYRELIADKNVAAVVIAVPNFLHAKIAIEAMKAGKDVLMEKPIGLNYQEGKSVAAAAEKYGRVLSVGMQRHYAADYKRIIEFVRGGELGKIHLYTLNEYRGDWNPKTWPWPNPRTGKRTPWRHLRSLAGSSLLEFSVHSYGFLYEMIKRPLTKCAATGGAVHWPERTTEDAISVIAEFGDIRLQHTYCGFARGVDWRMTVVGDNGSLEYDRNRTIVRLEDGDERDLDLNLKQSISNEAQMYREFFRAVQTRSQTALNPSFAIEATKLAYAAWLSIDEDRFVTDEDFV